MTATPNNPNSSPSQPNQEISAETIALLQLLRRKESNWVAWGQACQQLQKAGLSQQQIFEQTGFEPVQQNQVMVAAQVYGSIESGGAALAVLSRFEHTGSDSLYELRVLTQAERVAAATLLVEKSLDSEAAHEVAKALKDFARLPRKSDQFVDYPDDAVAHFYWNLARQQPDLQVRSRLIAQALRFAKSESARRQVEALLTDFRITRSRPAPRLPFYRLESAADQARILPIAGKLPLETADLQAVPLVESEGGFHIVKFSGVGAWAALPGWQVILAAIDPVLILAESNQLPGATTEVEAIEEVLILIDRAERTWEADSYFVVDQAGQLRLNWFEEAPELPLLGKVTLVLRPKQVLDEDFNKELWQLDE
jgi:hypothetical protein